MTKLEKQLIAILASVVSFNGNGTTKTVRRKGRKRRARRSFKSTKT